MGNISLIFLVKNWWIDIALIILGIILIVHEKKFLLFKAVLSSAFIIGTCMYLIYGTGVPGIQSDIEKPLFTIWKIAFYYSGVSYANDYFLRAIALMVSVFGIFTSLKVSDVSVFLRQIHFPYRLAFTFVYAFQAVILLGRNYRQIRDAQIARGKLMVVSYSVQRH